jgi:hypothetical protein
MLRYFLLYRDASHLTIRGQYLYLDVGAIFPEGYSTGEYSQGILPLIYLGGLAFSLSPRQISIFPARIGILR